MYPNPFEKWKTTAEHRRPLLPPLPYRKKSRVKGNRDHGTEREHGGPDGSWGIKGWEENYQENILGRQHEELEDGWDYGGPNGQAPGAYLIIPLDFTQRKNSKVKLSGVSRQ